MKMNKENTLIYLEFATREKLIGKVIIELFDNITPLTSNNFKTFCINRKMPTYLGCTMHRIIPGFVIQGGDFERNNGTGGYSIYGKTFNDENFKLKHDKEGLLSMANSGPHTNGSQFFITLNKTPHLDGKHVVFGRVLDGLDIVREIEEYGTDEGKPTDIIKIVGCGII